MKILPYKYGSKSAKKLKELFEGQVLFKKNNRRVKRKDIVVNWGFHKPVNFTTNHWLNRPEAVKIASNKLLAFQKLQEQQVPTVEFTTDQHVANQWLIDGKIVLSRTLLNSNSGKGIVVNKPEEYQVVHPAPLYTKYFKKTHELRVHIFCGEVIDYAQKKIRRERNESYNPMIRSHDNGWIYSWRDILELEEVKEVAKKAVLALGLDFGAVDIGYNENTGKILVFEVNTAPGLCDSTAQKYAVALEEIEQLWKQKQREVRV